MFGDYTPTDKELSTLIKWGASGVNSGEMSMENTDLLEKLIKIRDTRFKNAKSWAAFSKELEY
jgi:hypothetical protein